MKAPKPGKGVSSEAIPQHKKLAMGKPVPVGSSPKVPA